MEMKEFNEQVKRSEQGNEIIFDVRPFGARQGEAIDSYLHDRLMVLRMTGIGATDKHVVLLCDSTVQLPFATERWLNNLNADGHATEIRRSWFSPGKP